ncbi:Leucine-rich repeat and WD repeat-containing protein 1 [Entamoeba marina]
MQSILKFFTPAQPTSNFTHSIQSETGNTNPSTLISSNRRLCYDSRPLNQFSQLTNLSSVSLTDVGLTSLGVLTSLRLNYLDISKNSFQLINLSNMTTLSTLILDQNPLHHLKHLPISLNTLSIKNINFKSHYPTYTTLQQLTNLSSLSISPYAPFRPTTQQHIDSIQSQFDAIQNMSDDFAREEMGDNIAAFIQQLVNQLETMTNDAQTIDDCDNPFYWHILSNTTAKVINNEPLSTSKLIEKNKQLTRTPILKYIEQNHITPRYHKHDLISCQHFNSKTKEQSNRVCNYNACQNLNNEIGGTNKFRRLDGVDAPRQIEYSPVTADLLSGTINGEIYLLKDNMQPVNIPISSNSPIYGIGWYHNINNASNAVVGDANGDCFMVNTFQLTSNKVQSIEKLLSLHISSNDEHLITTGNDNGISLFDAQTLKIKQKLDSLHQGGVNVARFATLDPYMLITCSHDKTLKLWDLRTGFNEPIQTMKGKASFITVGFDGTDSSIVASGKDNYVCRYDIRKGEDVEGVPMKIQKLLSPENYSRSYFNCDNHSVLIASTKQNSLFMCDALTGDLLFEAYYDPTIHQYADGLLSLRPHPFDPYRAIVLPFEDNGFAIKGIYECDLIDFGC